MRILRFKNVNDVARAVEKELRDRALAQSAPLRIFLPTGGTPRPLYELMRKDPVFWKAKLAPIQIDEFIDQKRPFFTQLSEELLKPLGLEILAWNPSWSENEAIVFVNETLSKPVDIALLGLGPNGHVGFHEPGNSKTFLGGLATISEATKSRVIGAVTSKVYTFGVAAFLRAKEIFLVVIGSGKEKVFEELQNCEPTENLPASLLKFHKNLTIFTDQK